LAIVRAKAQQQGLNVAAIQNFIRLQMRVLPCRYKINGINNGAKMGLMTLSLIP
jgi:hypothetical protein